MAVDSAAGTAVRSGPCDWPLGQSWLVREGSDYV
jgi:hypothetical protein